MRELRHLVLLAVPLAASAAITNVQVTGTTATQAVLSYTAPNAGACVVQVSQSESLQPLVHDVNPALFEGASLDARESQNPVGLSRTFVVGRRTSSRAADGKFYSRALQTDTLHYFRISCGSDVATGTFRTTTIPLGDTSVEPPPFHPERPFNYAWPTMEYDNIDQQVIDPMTGVLVHRGRRPGGIGSATSPGARFGYVFDASGQWTSPDNARSGSASTLAQYGGSASDPLYLALNGLDWAWFDYGNPSGWSAGLKWDDVRVRAFGYGNQTDPADRTLILCWSADEGRSCYGNQLELVLPASAGSAVTVPSDFPKSSSAWGVPFPPQEVNPASGNVDVSGNQVTLIRGTGFRQDWPAGTRLLIRGTSPACPSEICTVASVASRSVLTLNETPPSLAGAQYSSLTLGLRVWKKTGIGAVNVSFNIDAATSKFDANSDSGAPEMCSSVPANTSVDRYGNPLGYTLKGYLCVMYATQGLPAIYWIGSNGESRLVAELRGSGNDSDPEADRAVSQRAVGAGAWDSTAPNVIYAVIPTTAGKRALFRITYTGDYRQLSDQYSYFAPEPVTYTNLTPASQGRDIDSLMAQHDPQWNAEFWGAAALLGVFADQAVLRFLPGGQDTACRLALMTATNPPSITKVLNSWDRPEMRWAICHSYGVVSGSGSAVAWISVKRPGIGTAPSKTFYGPWRFEVTRVYKNGTWNSDTSLTSTYADACPADLPQRWKDAGAVGTNCVMLRVNGEPCSYQPNIAAGEHTRFPCPWNANYSMLQTMEEGDTFTPSMANHSGERFRIVRKTPLPEGGFELVAQRRAFPPCGQTAPANGWSGAMTMDRACVATVAYTDREAGTGWTLEPEEIGGAHFDLGPAPDGKLAAVAAAYMVSAGRQPGAEPTPVNLRATPAAGGFAGQKSTVVWQSYPSLNQWDAGDRDKQWVLDFFHLNPAAGSGSEVPVQAFNTPVQGPVPGTAQVYTMAVYGGTPSIKRVPLVGVAGPYLLSEKSGPGSLITDADVWRFCVAYQAGECRPGSAAGQVFLNVPGIETTSCVVNQYSRRTPCVLNPLPVSAFATQWDITRNDPFGVNGRRITMGFSGYGRQYQFSNFRSIPDGTWGYLTAHWLEGQWHEHLLFKLPTWPNYDSVTRSTFIPVRVETGSVPPGTVTAHAEFGYDPGFHCSTRDEVCIANASSFTEAEPYLWASETWSGLSCAAGCTIAIPALPQRVLYYRLVYRDGAGQTVGQSGTSVLATP